MTAELLMTKHRKQEGGFTLVELLVVILIIGVLAAVALPMFMHQRNAAVSKPIEQMGATVEEWVAKNPTLPLGSTGTYVPFDTFKASVQEEKKLTLPSLLGDDDDWLVKVVGGDTPGAAYTICAQMESSYSSSSSRRSSSYTTYSFDSTTGETSYNRNPNCD